MVNESTEKLDLIGMRCPYPIMHTRKKMQSLENGNTLLVKATDPSFDIDLGVFIRQSGHILRCSWSKGGVSFYLIESR